MTALAHVAPAQLDDARRVLRILTAAFPTYPVGDDTAELYLAAICADMPDFATASRVALDWVQSQLLFPKVVELVDAYNVATQRARARAEIVRRSQRGSSDGSYACPRCKDTGFEFVKQMTRDVLYDAVVPCETCQLDERDYWRDGHYDSGHDVNACEHPRCEARAKSRGRRK